MKINSKIIETLIDKQLPIDDSILFLLAIYFKLETSVFSNTFIRTIHSLGIYTLDDTNFVWRVPLFEGGTTNFDWVKDEYVPMFKAKNKDKGGKVREATIRMKKFFADNPDIRKDEVIKATQVYLLNTDLRFIRYPHYFIKKGKGVEEVSDLYDWIQKIRDEEKPVKRTSLNNIMQ